MTDYIKREDAIAEFVTNGSATVYGIDNCKAIVSRLQLVPSADVVEVGTRYYTTEYKVTVTNDTREIEDKHGHILLAPGSSYFVIERLYK